MVDLVNLDIKDKKLLYHLSINARTSYPQLAKKVGLSKNSIKYRIERLQNEGIIKQFAAVTNLGALNLDTFTLLLKFNEDIYTNKNILNYFKNHEFADWFVTLSGQWDIFVEFTAKDFRHMNQIISEIINTFNQSLNTYQAYFSRTTLRVEHLISDIYEPIGLDQIPNKFRVTEKQSIDKTDKKILYLVNQDSSTSYTTIATTLNLSIDTVISRIKKLIDSGVLVKFFPEINLSKLGYTEYLYILKLKNLTNEKFTQIKNNLKNNKNITYCFVDSLGFNIISVCAFKTSEGIDNLSRSLRTNFSDIIEDQTYLIIKEQVLFNLFPKGLIEDN